MSAIERKYSSTATPRLSCLGKNVKSMASVCHETGRIRTLDRTRCGEINRSKRPLRHSTPPTPPPGRLALRPPRPMGLVLSSGHSCPPPPPGNVLIVRDHNTRSPCKFATPPISDGLIDAWSQCAALAQRCAQAQGHCRPPRLGSALCRRRCSEGFFVGGTPKVRSGSARTTPTSTWVRSMRVQVWNGQRTRDWLGPGFARLAWWAEKKVSSPPGTHRGAILACDHCPTCWLPSG